jgi:hypothetical protein
VPSYKSKFIILFGINGLAQDLQFSGGFSRHARRVMCNLTRFKSLLSIVSVVCVVLTIGCGTQTAHPNQLNAFDGASYDSLTLAHGALTSLRAQVSVSYPKYAPIFNEAAASDAAAYSAYALYRTNPANQVALSVALANLTVSIVALENSFQADMPLSAAITKGVREKAWTLRERAAGQNVTVSDILTELEIAAAIARALPAGQPYAGLASMVIAATSEAIAADTASSGQPIDLTTISPVAAL